MNVHDCPGECGRLIGRAVLACSYCWPRLPVELRRNVLRTWRVRQAGGDWRPHAAAVTDASRWFRANPAVAP